MQITEIYKSLQAGIGRLALQRFVDLSDLHEESAVSFRPVSFAVVGKGAIPNDGLFAVLCSGRIGLEDSYILHSHAALSDAVQDVTVLETDTTTAKYSE